MSLPPYQPSYDGDEAEAIAAHRIEPDLDYVCEECGQAFATAQGLGGHRKAHKKPSARARALRNGRAPFPIADTMRELVAKFDRLAELQAESRELEQEIEQLQARLVKAWQR